MAEPFIISCPKCGKQLKVSADAVGKKVRCKGCEEIFPVEDPGKMQAAVPKKKAAAGKPSAGKAAGKPEKPAPKPEEPMNRPATAAAGDDEEYEGGAYIMANMDLAPRCPQCAAPLDPPDAAICMECGFHTRTRTQIRTRKVKEVTGKDKFQWMLPGILAILGIVGMFAYWCIHHFVLPDEIYPGFNRISEGTDITRGQVCKAIADPEGFAKSQGQEDFVAKADQPKGDIWVYVFHPGAELWLLIVILFISYFLGRLAIRRLIINRQPPEVEVK